MKKEIIKVQLNKSMFNDFMEYANKRMNSITYKNYEYITKNSLILGFKYFEMMDLTSNNKGECWRILNNKKDFFSNGFSGIDKLYRYTNENDIKNDLFHNVFCKIEWIMRSKKEDYYKKSVKQFLGKSYKLFIN